jgi:hypothetical protein
MKPIALTLVGCLAAAGLHAAEVTRTLNLTVPDSSHRFAVENLSGTMRVVPGTGADAVVVVTVHAESQALADSVRFETVSGDHGVPTLRVRYPVHDYDTFRAPGRKDHDHGFLSGLFGGGSNLRYDGVRVRVSGSAGVLLYADVEVELPRRDVDARFLNHVGSLQGREASGQLRFEADSGDVKIDGLHGEIVADTGAGDVVASHIDGSFSCDTGSGDCSVDSFKGERLSCDTGSGEVRLRGVEARSLTVDTGSGDVKVEDTRAEAAKFDTGSGDVSFEGDGTRLHSLHADTGSGDVTLRLGRDASFEAQADVGSGDIVSHYADAQPIVKKREVVGYRRGDAQIRIDVDTGSGSLILEP